MTDPEDPAAKNEQELNLFSDQPCPGDAPAEQDPGAYADPADFPAQEPPAEPESGNPAAEAEEPVPGDNPAERKRNDPDADGSPVVAPPPAPRKQSAPVRPGIVQPRAGRAPQPSAAAPSSAVRSRKPLPHALQQSQTLGQMLTAIRSARGMSVEEVAGHTRIRLEYLLELEAGELLQKLPPVYVSAYVRKLIEVYDLSGADSDVLLEKLREETPQDPEELSDKLLESVNEGALVNEGENKRIRNITIGVFIVIGLVAAALLWLVFLVIVNYARTSEPVPGRDPAAASASAGAVQPAEEPVSRTILLDESALDVLIVPETPSISVLKMSKSPGVRESL